MPWRKYIQRFSWLPLVGIVFVGVLLVGRGSDSPQPMNLNQFLNEVKANHVSEAVIQPSGKSVEATVNDKSYVIEFPAEYSDELAAQLVAEDVPVKTDKSSALVSVFKALWFPVMLLFLFGMPYFLPRLEQWREERTRTNNELPEERFSDIRGADEVVNGLKELLEFLKDPSPFENAGVEVERGVLLHGESGTGKSSVARALAGEAGVPFFWLSGSGFSAKYIGEGAARVRRLVRRVKSVKGTAVVLIDEIDSVGVKRYEGEGGAHEHTTTLNELLVQLDILMKMRNVVVIATTNRPEVLDTALIRPGRLHRRLHMPVPDRLAREQIFRMYVSKLKNVDPDLSYSTMSMSTFGLTGAQIEAVANQAGLAALREGTDVPVSNRHIMEGVQVVLAGDKKAKVFSDEERQIVAAHESGHALVALLTEGAPRPHYVTIVPRGETGGSTWMSYEDDQNLITRSQAKARLRVIMGGRAAEELTLEGNFSSGPAHDLQSATDLAVQMVGHWGMAPGFLMVPDQRGLYDDPRSDELAAAVDKLIAEALQEAKGLLEQHRGQFDQLMADLVTRETLERSDLERLVITA
jgi:cell division protease FtsH